MILNFFIVFSLALSTFSLSSGSSVDFTCPIANITGNGAFPPGALNLTQFPANYTCVQNFVIPSGSVLKFTVHSNSTNRTVDKLYILGAKSSSPFSAYNGINYYYAPADFANLIIITKTNTSKFWVEYEYMKIDKLQPSTLPIATPVPLSLNSTNQYTFSSPNNQQIIIHTSSSIYSQDPLLQNILVYDGPDTNSPYLGNLFDITFLYTDERGVSSGNSLTMVNLYGDETFFSYALVNEYKYIAASQFLYSFRVFSKTEPIDTRIYPSETTNFVTFYCPDCQESYISLLESRFPQIQQQGINFQPLTPTDNKDVLLSYGAHDQLPLKLPQMIPGNLFTMKTSTEMLSLIVESNNNVRANWTRAYPGRTGVVFSPSLWAPGATPAYDWKFQSATPLKFLVNIESAVIASPGEQISVQIGSAGSAPFTTTFTKSVANPSVRVANGTYMQVTYTGNNTGSSSIVTFEMDSLADMVPTSTPKDGSGMGVFGVHNLVVVLVALLMLMY